MINTDLFHCVEAEDEVGNDKGLLPKKSHPDKAVSIFRTEYEESSTERSCLDLHVFFMSIWLFSPRLSAGKEKK